MEYTPRLRAVEAFPVQVEGQRLVCLRDPEGYSQKPVFLNQILLFLVSRMNGNNTLRDIQADFLRATGEILPMENLESLVRQLDEQCLLDSDRFRTHSLKQARDFLENPVRHAHHAGNAYEAEPGALEEQILRFYSDPEGPTAACSRDAANALRGLVAPHIDFHRGGPTYAHAYKTLAGHTSLNRIILFGTCHTPMARRFALTKKDFETPIGTVTTDKKFVERLSSRLPVDYFSDEISHRAEHSLEFQAVMLKHALKDQPDLEIIPVLVGSFHDICEAGKSPAEDDEIQAFIAAVRETMAEMAGNYCAIAAADLSHVGRRFGDDSGPTEGSMKAVELEDLELLRQVEAGDAEGMFRSIAASGDRRRVCGYPPIYMTLSVLKTSRGQLLQYRQWTDYDSGAAVTFAAVVLY